MTFLSLYSGIGLHDLGFERAGWRCAGQVELDPYCAAVLAKHWPDLPRWRDVRSVTVDAVRGACGRIDAIVGGFMCTDISVAGKGAGLGKRTRSGLTWREMFRLIRGLRPVLLVIENVPRLRTLGADRVLAALERSGYACRALVVGAEHVGAPHRRHRVWIIGRLAHANNGQCRASGHSDDQAGTNDAAIGAGHRCIFPGGCWRCAPQLRDADVLPRGNELATTGQQGQARPAARHDEVADTESRGFGTDGIARGGNRHADERGSRWPSRPGQPQHEWEAPRLTQSRMGDAASRRAGRVAGFARRNALRALGNGNPPQVAELIGRAILAAHREAVST